MDVFKRDYSNFDYNTFLEDVKKGKIHCNEEQRKYHGNENTMDNQVTSKEPFPVSPSTDHHPRRRKHLHKN